jgi:hypothetical protein
MDFSLAIARAFVCEETLQRAELTGCKAAVESTGYEAGGIAVTLRPVGAYSDHEDHPRSQPRHRISHSRGRLCEPDRTRRRAVLHEWLLPRLPLLRERPRALTNPAWTAPRFNA